MSKIVLLKDVYALKEQKEKELRFYSEKKKELEEKLYWLERDLKLTRDIIKMIEEERVLNVQSVPDL
ncbi:MAG: hypothetical protein EB127_14080 [Alphaproteobacteria bacterium]|nr:hypothetical protein [Alphaproteobacteria bacterium]